MQVDDAARPTGSWGIFRVRAVDGDRVMVDAGEGAWWVDASEVECLHTPRRWAEGEFTPGPLFTESGKPVPMPTGQVTR